MATITNTKRTASEVARDIDWKEVRRVQHGLGRPIRSDAGPRFGFGSYEEIEVVEANRRRITRLAHVLGLLSGLLLGVAILRGLSEEPVLLSAALLLAITGMVAAQHGAP